MRRTVLRAKLYRLRVTRAELDYEGSIAIDAELLAAADIREYERVEVYNVSNGARFATYAVAAPAGSGTVSVMGAAARRAAAGDELIVCAYAALEEAELAAFEPRLVRVDGRNRPRAAVAPVPGDEESETGDRGSGNRSAKVLKY